MKKIKKQELLRRQSYRVSATKIKDDKPEWSKKKTKKDLESFVVDQIRPRLSVFRSNRHIYAQIIDDTKGHTLVSASSAEIKDQKGTKTEIAARVGELLAKKTKGGNRIGFSVLVVVGDKKGQVGVGLGKAPDVTSAVKKGVAYAKKHL